MFVSALVIRNAASLVAVKPVIKRFMCNVLVDF
jgi:hypothetical protein